MTWISFSVRYLVNVEDLNNVESAGNYVRHRRAPIVVKENDKTYSVTYVPAVSGEMIAHGYQANLADIATQKGLPVEDLVKQGVLLKRGAGDSVHNSKCEDKKGSDYEQCVISEDVVEDVAGFMNPNKLIKRTSNIAFSYMIPALDTVKASAIASQFQVRYATKELIDKHKNENIQSLYNVETASASYVLTGYLNLDGIGITQNYPVKEVECEGKSECRKERMKCALDSLTLTLTQFLFGAKRSRYNPLTEIEALVLSVSEKPFNIPPINGNIKEYLELVRNTANSFGKVLGINTPTVVFYAKGVEGSKSNPVEVFEEYGKIRRIWKNKRR
ncbi:type I-A CRISPR-associated protein Cas7/Csa2 [Sulfuracidifex tepidarius]|uniref:CRISPR-associated protein Cas7/Csa2 1 n=1 Tax=Sulfuracidifex tepidarius TaxID=1294262 RepID=A0A510E5V1_9CREN|nr:type I-A CRISPR-associated protein Cas7/Csa2 [Sulfuracidifex tepidarius]BBG27856.1 CRISPR-associated protein Cas7/Csa2 1 [Sulfuracidifex tepidarius]